MLNNYDNSNDKVDFDRFNVKIGFEKRKGSEK